MVSYSKSLASSVIKSLYNVLEWYSKNPGAGKAGIILQYYAMWKSLHTLSTNISKTSWNAINNMAETLGIYLHDDNDRWKFLYSIETYLNILMRAIALNKLGRAASDHRDFRNKINSIRSIFSPNVFEWVFEALNDQSLDQKLKNDLLRSVNSLIQVVSALNVAIISFDAFRVMYQNVLPREIRKSLGEFYTNEDIVDEVLDAAGLDCKTLEKLYYKWKEGYKAKILDPSCGSGSFLVRLIYRIFKCLGCKPDIAEFIESLLYGIDVNPFAAEMAKLNLILAISDGMRATCRYAIYAVQKVNVYWGDSLALLREQLDPTGIKLLKLRIPSLAPAISKGYKEEDLLLPSPDIVDPVKIIDII